MKGASQSATLAASALSERSGQASSGSARRRKATRSRHCASAFVNGSRAIPPPSASSAAMPFGERAGGFWSRRRRQVLFAEDDRAEPASFTGAQGRAVAVETDLFEARDVSSGDAFEIGLAQRRRRDDPGGAGAAGNFRDGEKGFARQRADAARAWPRAHWP